MLPTAHASTEASGLEFPGTTCCNCGATVGVELRPTTLRLTRYWLLGGSEWTLPARVPVCADCAPTLSRIDPGLMGRFLVFALTFFALLVVVVVVQSSRDGEVSDLMLAGVAVASALAVWIGFGRRVPVGRQTSYYQPIRVLKLRQTFMGALTGLVLGFTNERTAFAFAAKLGTGAPGRRGALWTVDWTPPPGGT